MIYSQKWYPSIYHLDFNRPFLWFSRNQNLGWKKSVMSRFLLPNVFATLNSVQGVHTR